MRLEDKTVYQTDTIRQLLARVATVADVAIAKQPAIGVSGTIEAARKMAQGLRDRPWMAWTAGMEASLTEAEYDQLRAMGANEVNYAEIRKYRERWWYERGKLGPIVAEGPGGRVAIEEIVRVPKR